MSPLTVSITTVFFYIFFYHDPLYLNHLHLKHSRFPKEPIHGKLQIIKQ